MGGNCESGRNAWTSGQVDLSNSGGHAILEERLETCIEKALNATTVDFKGTGQHVTVGQDGSEGGTARVQSLKPEDIHVLVVDDEHMSRTVVSSLLKKCKYTVTTAEDGAEAMELLRSNAPGTFHLVLTDVRMPQMSGIELLQYVRSEDALRSVPVVMMSSIENGETVYECVEGGAEEYLVKPVTQKEIQHIWQHVLRKRSAVTTVPQAQSTESQDKFELATRKAPMMTEQPLQEVMKAVDMSRSASAASAMAAPSADGKDVDLAFAGDFLKLMRDARLEEMRKLTNQVNALKHDYEHLSQSMAAKLQHEPDEEGTKKRCKWTPGEVCIPEAFNSVGKRHVLEDMYFDIRKQDSAEMDGSNGLKQFTEGLTVLSQVNDFSVMSIIRSGSMASPQEMVCCSDFDADDSHFATVSVSRSVKVFDFSSMTNNPEALQFPVWQATTRSKLSSVSWNSYIRSYLITSDYDGLVQLWDVSTGSSADICQFEEHEKRVWSVDFSRLDPMQFASASDDATVRIWNINHQSPIACLHTPANACSVQFSPHNANILAVACANHNNYVFDVRQVDTPLAVLTDSKRALSYVRFLDANTVVGASTDSTIRTWDISDVSERHIEDGPFMTVGIPHDKTYEGHINERNFVGLSVHPDGFIATGSEDNSVHCYYRAFPFSVARHSLGDKYENSKQEAERKPKTFVSSVSWSRHSKHLLVGNSEGVLKVLYIL
eukprot:jgi/Picsp_1/3820/NSC_01332-R1_protein spa1-related 2-like